MRRLAAASVLVLFLIPGLSLAAPNDPYYDLQWGLARVKAATAWQVSQGSGAIVAVIDTGIDLGHPDLRGRLLPGHDFVDGDNVAQDGNGHGTLVAGIVAADSKNGIGVASVAPKASLLPIRVLDAQGTGNSNDVADGISWAVHHGADVINLSLAQDASDQSLVLLHDATVDQAIKDAAAAGAVVVVAAGNNAGGGVSSTPYQATVPGVVVVGASTNRDRRAAYSNYGSGLDLLAPGGGSDANPSDTGCSESNAIVSTWWNPKSRRSSYGGACGTSMAVGFVSGVAALLKARGMSNDAVVRRILATADDIGARGTDAQTGAGILNAARAVGARVVKAKPKPPVSTPVRRSSTKPPVRVAAAPPRRHVAAPKEPVVGVARGLEDSGLEPALGLARASLPLERNAPITAAAALLVLTAVGHTVRVASRRRRRFGN
jgi:subtilisin family serine protease